MPSNLRQARFGRGYVSNPSCRGAIAGRVFGWGLLLCVGCGPDLPLAPVSGTVTLNGSPLVGASITTQPIATSDKNPGSGSFGVTDGQGRFELELVKPKLMGAIIGEHRVMVSPATSEGPKNQPGQSATSEERWADDPNSHRAIAAKKWPTRFVDGSLRLQVPPGGASDVRLDLK